MMTRLNALAESITLAYDKTTSPWHGKMIPCSHSIALNTAESFLSTTDKQRLRSESGEHRNGVGKRRASNDEV